MANESKQNTCPERECHDNVQSALSMAKESHAALFEKGGVENQLEAIRLELGKKMRSIEADSKFMKKPHWGIWVGFLVTIGLSLFSSFVSLRDSAKASPLIYFTKEEAKDLTLELKGLDTKQQLSDKEIKNIHSCISDIKDIQSDMKTDFNKALTEQKKDVAVRVDEIKTLIKTIHDKESVNVRNR